MKIYLLVFLCLSSVVYSQNSISGWLKDTDTQEPVPYATVYIDGTTNGTVSDTDGFFELTNVSLPYRLVLSHVTYNTRTIEISEKYTSSVNISLEKRKNVLNEIKVEDNDHRQYNIDYFKSKFLGSDIWGKQASIMNDSVLSFSKKEVKDTLSYKVTEQYGDSTTSKIKNRESEFRAYASSQIIVDMPKLGYMLHVDLVNFCIETSNNWVTKTSYLGYYYYQPYELDNTRKAKRIENNRKEAYYNSSQHFCRSLFSKTLARNGYIIYKRSHTNKRKVYKEFNIDSCLISIDEIQVGITGLKGENLIVYYYHNNDGTPRDLDTKGIGYKAESSVIYFRNDTCVVTKNGIIPNNNILFSGQIAKKATGASLPDDFILTEN